jgi:hypothetical protein
MAAALRQVVSVSNDDDCRAATTFITQLTSVYQLLYNTGKECIERCFFGQLFGEMMSLNPAIIKFCEVAINGITPLQQIEGDESLTATDTSIYGNDDIDDKERKSMAALATSKYTQKMIPYLTVLHRTVDTLRTYVAGEKVTSIASLPA